MKEPINSEVSPEIAEKLASDLTTSFVMALLEQNLPEETTLAPLIPGLTLGEVREWLEEDENMPTVT